MLSILTRPLESASDMVNRSASGLGLFFIAIYAMVAALKTYMQNQADIFTVPGVFPYSSPFTFITGLFAVTLTTVLLSVFLFFALDSVVFRGSLTFRKAICLVGVSLLCETAFSILSLFFYHFNLPYTYKLLIIGAFSARLILIFLYALTSQLAKSKLFYCLILYFIGFRILEVLSVWLFL